MKTFKVTGESKFESDERRTWIYEAESKEELINRLRNSSLSIPSSTFEEIESVLENKEIAEKKTEMQIEKEKIRKVMSSPTRDSLLYEMDTQGVDSISIIESSGNLGKSITTYHREDLGTFFSEYILDDGSVNKRAVQLHLEQFCVNFSNRTDLEKKLKTEAEKILKERAYEVQPTIEMLIDWSVA